MVKTLTITAAIIAAGIVAGIAGAAGRIALSDDTISQWLDNGSNHPAFIAWANANLTGEQILSLELLMSPPPSDTDKRAVLDRAMQILEAGGIRSGRAIEAITGERDRLPAIVVEPVDDDTPRGRP